MQIEGITISETFRKVLLVGEIDHHVQVRPRGPRTFTAIAIRQSVSGSGSVTSTLVHRHAGCDFTKTFRHAGLMMLEASVVLGWQPTRQDMVRHLDIPGSLEFTSGAGNPNTQIIDYDPRVGELCDGYREYLLGDLFSTFGAGKCYEPAGAVLTYDRDCLAVYPFGVGFTLQAIKRQTLGRLEFPINRLWARKSFIIEKRKRERLSDGSVAEIEAQITFTRRPG